MKICVISPLGYTGIAYYDHSLCQSLSELGVNVVLISTKTRAVEAKKRNYLVLRAFNGTYGNKSLLLKGFNYILSIVKAYIFIKKNHFKVVHFQILELPEIDFFIFLLLKISGVRIVFTPHDICSFKNRGNTFLSMMYRLSNYVIVHNLTNRDLLINMFKIKAEKIKIVIHGNYNYFINPKIQKDEARDKIGIRRDKKVLLLFGNIRPGKGLETLVSAFILLRKNRKDVLLLIAGKPVKGYDLELILKEIKVRNFADSLTLRNYFIEDSLVEYYYKSSDVVIIPYECVYESGVLRYAFSCGVPTIVSNLKEFLEFAIDGENCLVFKAKDAANLAEKLNIILQYPHIANKLSYNAMKLSEEKWDWRKSAYETKKIYEQLL